MKRLLARIKLFTIICNRSFAGIESPLSPFWCVFEYTVWLLFHKRLKIREQNNEDWLRRKFKRENYYDFKGIKIPLLECEYEIPMLRLVFPTVFVPYLFFDNHFYLPLYEKYAYGYYSLEEPDFSVIVKKGDVVIDAGSWIGDFAAYASVCGATVFAFEANPDTFKKLQETAKLNNNIKSFNLGLGRESKTLPLFVGVNPYSLGDTFDLRSVYANDSETHHKKDVNVVSLDDFVSTNDIVRVDFIKANIEGFERDLLEGAIKVLEKFAPKLVICTNHLPDDPEVLEGLIIKSNPRYRIRHVCDVLFAVADGDM